MKREAFCVKCGCYQIIRIRSPYNVYGIGNISAAPQMRSSEKRYASITYYICEDCGYVEHYLEDSEIEKIKKYKDKKTLLDKIIELTPEE